MEVGEHLFNRYNEFEKKGTMLYSMKNSCSSAFDDWVREVLVISRHGLSIWHFFHQAACPQKEVPKEDCFFLR